MGADELTPEHPDSPVWENADGSTNVDGFLAAYAADTNTFWRAEMGHVMNVLDELIDRASTPENTATPTFNTSIGWDVTDMRPKNTATLTCSHGVPVTECPDRDAHHASTPENTADLPECSMGYDCDDTTHDGHCGEPRQENTASLTKEES
jgi:hypothetical protein